MRAPFPRTELDKRGNRAPTKGKQCMPEERWWVENQNQVIDDGQDGRGVRRLTYPIVTKGLRARDVGDPSGGAMNVDVNV